MLVMAVWCLFYEAQAQDYAVNVGVSDVNVVADRSQDRDLVRTKSFSRTFAVDRSDKINLNNQFGSIVVKVWDRKEVKLDISIIASSSNVNEAQKLIDEVTVAVEKTGDLISGKTSIGRGNRWSSGRNKKREVKINYVVYMPAINALTVTQQFGNVTLGDLSGALSANVQYGNLVAGNLSSLNNYVDVQYGKTNIAEANKIVIKQQYGSGLTLGNVGSLDIDAQYVGVNIGNVRGNAIIKQQYGSGLTLASVNNLNLDIQYATANITAIKGTAVIDQQYNSLKIGSVGKITIRSEYAGVNIGALRGDGSFRMSYNDLNLNDIGAGCKNLTIDADYVDVNLNFNPGYNADFNVRRSYGSFKYGSNIKARVSGDDDDSSNKRYTGKIGNGGGAIVNIVTEYGNVTFK